MSEGSRVILCIFFLSVQTLGCCRWRYTSNASQSTTSASLVSFIENSKLLRWLKELTLHRWETWNNYHTAWGSRWPSPWVHPCTLVFAMETSQVGGQWGELTWKHPVLKHLGKQEYLKTFVLLSGHPWVSRSESELNGSTTAAHLVIYFYCT